MKIEKHISDIIRRYNSGETITFIAKSLGVNTQTINNLLNGTTYGGLYKQREKDNRAFGRDIVLQINGRNIKFKSIRSLAKVLGLSECHISNILAGRHPIPIIEEIRYA